jgi:tRNA-Thr(GGU) m(6)t(6)A37 methyltransferase TsaA
MAELSTPCPQEVDSLNEEPSKGIEMQPIGIIGHSVVKVFPAYLEGLKGIEEFSHVWVFYWFHENDDPTGRAFLRVRPRKDPRNPLTGVFGTRSPLRPNLIAMSLCKIKEVKPETGEIVVDSLDARDGSPLIDVKPYLPYSDRAEELRLPEWAKTPPDAL